MLISMSDLSPRIGRLGSLTGEPASVAQQAVRSAQDRLYPSNGAGGRPCYGPPRGHSRGDTARGAPARGWAGAQMEFRVLGPLEVVVEGRSLALGGAKQRALLAVLVLDANRIRVDRPTDRRAMGRGGARRRRSHAAGLRVPGAQGASDRRVAAARHDSRHAGTGVRPACRARRGRSPALRADRGRRAASARSR